VLLLTGGFVTYALRGPQFDFPSSPAAAVAVFVAAESLGHLARLAAAGAAWVVDALWAHDLFLDRPASELLDELSPRRLSPDLLARLDAALRTPFGLTIEPVARSERDDIRERKSRQLLEAVALARARAAKDMATAATAARLEARSDAARALCAALGLAALGTLAVAVHDYLFARAVAHALSSFSLVVLGLTLLVAAFASLGRARSASRRLVVEMLLQLVSDDTEKEGAHPSGPNPPSTGDPGRPL
jgi:hypothetical protein